MEAKRSSSSGSKSRATVKVALLGGDLRNLSLARGLKQGGTLGLPPSSSMKTTPVLPLLRRLRGVTLLEFFLLALALGLLLRSHLAKEPTMIFARKGCVDQLLHAFRALRLRASGGDGLVD